MLVLASASPRRRELLQNAGITFTVQPSDIPEVPLAGESAKGFAERLAQEKALAVFRLNSKDPVLGADTVVVVEHEILGKPRDREDAARMLCSLSARRAPGRDRGLPGGRRDTTRCSVRDYRGYDEQNRGTEKLQDYIATGEPMDKAGAYAIQGIASRWITGIEGDYSNVVGLPVPLVWEMLRQYGVV